MRARPLRAVDEQYLAKYGRFGARYVESMGAAGVRAMTLRLVPPLGGSEE